jgi:ATP-dependent Clp protease ATP-binding subunit ClpA
MIGNGDARRTVLQAAETARASGDARIGTDHLLIALLSQRSSLSARLLGVSAADAGQASRDLDRVALSAVGIDVGDIPPTPPMASRTRPGLTSGSRNVLKTAVQRAAGTRPRRRVTEADLLLAILALKPPDPAADLIDRLGIDRDAVRQQL